MKKTILTLSASLLLIGATLYSCKKSDTSSTSGDASIAATSDHVLAANTFEDVNQIAENGFPNGSSQQLQGASHGLLLATDSSSRRVTEGPHYFKFWGNFGDSVTVVPPTDTTWGSVTFNFGTTGITVGGVTRRGVIYAKFKGNFFVKGFIDTVTFSNYYVNDVQVQGTVVLTRNATDTIERKVINGLLSFPDGTTHSINLDHLRGYTYLDTIKHTIGQVSITGSASGVSRKGNAYQSVISPSNPVIIDFSCLPISGDIPTRGQVTVTSASWANPRIIDYGNGTCDRTYTITNGNKVITVYVD